MEVKCEKRKEGARGLKLAVRFYRSSSSGDGNAGREWGRSKLLAVMCVGVGRSAERREVQCTRRVYKKKVPATC